jgi:hypothetical protein
MRFAFSSPSGDADLEFVRVSPADSLADVVADLTRQPAPDVVYVDDRPVRSDIPLTACGLVDGAVVGLSPAPRNVGAAVLVQLTGRGAGSRRTLHVGTYQLGGSRHASVAALADGSVITPRATITVDASSQVRVSSLTGRLDGASCAELTEWLQQILTVDGRHFRLDSPLTPGDVGSVDRADGRSNYRRPSLVPPPPPPEVIATPEVTPGTREFEVALHTLAHHHARAAMAARGRHPDLAQAVRWAYGPSTRLWERRPWRPDAYQVPVGLADVPWDPTIAGESAATRAMIAQLGPLPAVPVQVDLLAHRGVGVTAAEPFAAAVARAMVITAAVLHGPADLGIVVLTDSVHADSWDWVKWLPHCRAGGRVQIWSAADDIDAWVQAQLASERPRATGHGQSVRLTMVVTDAFELWGAKDAVLRPVLADPSLSIRVLAVAPDAAHLPPICTAMLTRSSDGSYVLDTGIGQPSVEGIGTYQLDLDACEATARRLARWEDPDFEPGTELAPHGNTEGMLQPWVISRQLSAMEHRIAIRGNEGFDLLDPPSRPQAVANAIAPDAVAAGTPMVLAPRGDGIGIEVLPDAVCAVRLDAATVGRVTAAVTVHCSTEDDNDLRRALADVRSQLHAHEQPTVVAVWTNSGQMQSVDITGLSPRELRQLRSDALDDGFDVLLSHRAGVRNWWTVHNGLEEMLRVEHAAAAAGFRVIASEPSPLSAARLMGQSSVSLALTRGLGNGFVTFVGNGIVLLTTGTLRKPTSTEPAIEYCTWEPTDSQFRWLLDSRDRTSLLEQVAVTERVPPRLELVGDPYPDYPPSHSAWAPRVIIALGAAVRAAGLAGRQPVREVMVAAVFIDAANRLWAVEQVAEQPPAAIERPSRLRRAMLRR